jgi:Fe-S cluster assembly ATP-binding protein
MLIIDNLTIQTDDKIILQNFNLKIEKSGVYALVGANGSGKSSLAKLIMGIGDYKTSGQILWQKSSNSSINSNENVGNNFGNSLKESFDLTMLGVEEKAKLGIFLSFQNPPAIKGVSCLNLLKVALENQADNGKDENQNHSLNLERMNLKTNNLGRNSDLENDVRNEEKRDRERPKTKPSQILEKIKKHAKTLEIGTLYRQKMDNLSGGERKKLELLQLLCLEANLAILDELDSGLDAKSIKTIAQIIKNYTHKNDKTVLVISHNSHFLDLLKPVKIFEIGE